jgi:hypothetical protein
MALRRWKVVLVLKAHLHSPRARSNRLLRRVFYVRASTQQDAESFARAALRMLERKELTLDDVVLTTLLRQERGKDEESE